MLAAGDSNGRIYLWNLSAGKLAAAKPVAALVNPGGPVTSLLTGGEQDRGLLRRLQPRRQDTA